MVVHGGVEGGGRGADGGGALWSRRRMSRSGGDAWWWRRRKRKPSLHPGRKKEERVSMPSRPYAEMKCEEKWEKKLFHFFAFVLKNFRLERGKTADANDAHSTVSLPPDDDNVAAVLKLDGLYFSRFTNGPLRS